MQWSFVFVAFMHLVFLFYEFGNKNEENHCEYYKNSKRINIKIKKLDEKLLLDGNLVLSDLRPGFGPCAKVAGPNDSGLSLRLHQRLNDYILYPKELIEAQLQGYVQGELYFDENGFFKEEYSIFNTTNNYLKVHTIRSIRRALNNIEFQNNSKRPYEFEVVVKYVLTTNRAVRSESFLLRDNGLLLIRKAYGVSNGRDQIVKGVEKVITHISNFFTLFEYLPDSKKEKFKKTKFFEELRNDKAW